MAMEVKKPETGMYHGVRGQSIPASGSLSAIAEGENGLD